MHNKGIYYKGNVYNIWHLDEFFKVRWISTLMIQLHTLYIQSQSFLILQS